MNNIDRKEAVRNIYKEAEAAGFTVQQFERTCVVLHPKDAEQRKIALEIEKKYEQIEYEANGDVKHISLSVNVK